MKRMNNVNNKTIIERFIIEVSVGTIELIILAVVIFYIPYLVYERERQEGS